MTQFTESKKRKEDIPAEVQIQRLKDQLRYQYGRLGYVQANTPNNTKRLKYHTDKIDYIIRRLEELNGLQAED